MIKIMDSTMKIFIVRGSSLGINKSVTSREALHKELRDDDVVFIRPPIQTHLSEAKCLGLMTMD